MGIYLGKLQRPHCDLTIIIISKGNHPKMDLIEVSEILYFSQIYGNIWEYSDTIT